MTADDRVAAARAGDVDAFEDLLRQHDDRMRAVAHRMLGTRAAMDDALQDAYVKAFRSIHRFRGDAAFSTWLYRIVTTTCLDHLRRTTRRREDELPDEPAQTSGRPPDRVGDTVSGHLDLRAALAKLAPDHRAALLLVDGEGLSYDEAGVVLGVPAGTVASRLSRARTTMRDLLGEAHR